MWRSLIVAITITMMGFSQNIPSTTGSIAGTVFDSDGKPLSEATVFVGTLANGPRATTNSEGEFLLKNVPAGKVGLQAFKESDGHPYNMFSFFLMPGEQLTKLDLGPGETAKNVVIHLGIKAAYLKLEITDEDGTPVNVGVSLSRPDLGQYGDYQRSINSSDVILVPPVPFRLTVEGDSFEPWHYGGTGWQTEKGLIRLKSGQTFNLAVQLRRAAKP